MALRFLFTAKPQLKTPVRPPSSPAIFSSFSYYFSSRCRRDAAVTFSIPSQSPPVAKKVPFTVSAHGRTWQDPYHWMRNTADPSFVEYINEENAYAQAFMADTQHLQRTLVDEMRSRIPTKISTPPEPWGPWLYYEYIPEGKEYPVLCRKLDPKVNNSRMKTFLSYITGQFGREQRLLDWNEIAERYGYVHVGSCRVSPDHNFLAYTLDTTGREDFMLQIKDLRNGSIVPGPHVNGVISLAWAQDSSTLFYTISDDNQRPYRVLCSKIGSDEIDNYPIFTENDSSYCVDITSTKDGKFITVNSNSRTSSEEGIYLFNLNDIFMSVYFLLSSEAYALCLPLQVYVIDAISPFHGMQRIHKRVSGVQYFLEHNSGIFYILTNAPLSENKKWLGGNYYLTSCQVEHIQSPHWQNILPGEDMSFQDIDILHGHLVLFLNKKDIPMLCSINLPIKARSKDHFQLEDLDPWFFPVPSDLCSIVPGSNHDFMKPVYRVVLSSPVMPDMVVDYDMSKQTFSVLVQEEVGCASSDHRSSSLVYKTHEYLDAQSNDVKNAENNELQRWKDFSNTYCCKREEVISYDGVMIPLTILYSQKAWLGCESPGLLQGYGAYGEVLDKSWCSDRLSLLDRGWVLAFADVRGGGGRDASWHKSGSGLNKKNSVFDFLSCGDYLVNEGYVHKDRLGAIGVSAGGLLVGAAINMKPDLFRAAVLTVPFLDICNTLLDPTLPLTVLDHEEFGNPQLESHLESILNYSPYDNIHCSRCYPAMLIAASFHDTRVGVWEAAKWVARLRDCTCSSCSRSVILKTNMIGGHFGEGGSHNHCKETAYVYAFLMKTFSC